MVLPFRHSPLVITTSPGNALSSLNRPSDVTSEPGGKVMPRKNRFREKPAEISSDFKISSATYPFVVPAMMTNVPFFKASDTAGCAAKALAIKRLPADGVTTNCFKGFTPLRYYPIID
jgi:hypothetical protein